MRAILSRLLELPEPLKRKPHAFTHTDTLKAVHFFFPSSYPFLYFTPLYLIFFLSAPNSFLQKSEFIYTEHRNFLLQSFAQAHAAAIPIQNKTVVLPFCYESTSSHTFRHLALVHCPVNIMPTTATTTQTHDILMTLSLPPFLVKNKTLCLLFSFSLT